MKTKALLFDLDGTLADTATVNAMAYAAALAEVGVQVDLGHLIQIASGRNWRQFLPPLLLISGIAADPAAIADRKKIFYADMIKHVEINTALIMLLTASRPLHKTALVTTASGSNVKAILDYHGLAGLFDIIVTGDDVTRHKPDPEAYLLACRVLNLLPAHCIAFEDSDIGVASAEAAGVAVIRVVFQKAHVFISVNNP